MPWWNPWSAPKVRPAESAVPPAGGTPTPPPPPEAPDPPTTTAADHTRARAALRGLSPIVAAFVDRYGFAPRIEAVRAGRSALRPMERDAVARQLADLSQGQRLELRRALVQSPPHDDFARIRSHAAVKGAPTVDALMAILDGTVFGAAVEAYVAPELPPYDRIFAVGRRVETDVDFSIGFQIGFAAISVADFNPIPVDPPFDQRVSEFQF